MRLIGLRVVVRSSESGLGTTPSIACGQLNQRDTALDEQDVTKRQAGRLRRTASPRNQLHCMVAMG